MKNRTLFAGCVGCAVLGVIVVGIAIGAAIVWGRNRAPAVAQTIPPNSEPILITLVNPPNNSHYPENGWVPVQAYTKSKLPITAVELWVNGALIETHTPDAKDDPTSFMTRFDYPPGGPADMTFVVRARDLQNRVASSNAVHVGTTAPVGGRIAYKAKKGDTVASILEEFKDLQATPQKIIDANPGLNETQPITPGLYVYIPFDPPPSPQLKKPLLPPPPHPPLDKAMPTAPMLASTAEGCNVKLTITDNSTNESGFFVYRLDPGASTFVRIATLNANSGAPTLQYTDANQSGKIEYYASAFSSAGESKSNLTGVEVRDAACQPAPSSELKLEDGKLTLPQAVDLAYFYASINQAPYVRVPLNPKDFFKASGQTIDLRQYLDAIASDQKRMHLEVDLEVWGWKGEDLVNLGKLHTAMNYSELKVCLPGRGCYGEFAARVTEDVIALDESYQTREFYWRTGAPDVTGILYQVSTRPFAPKFELKPAGLISSTIKSETGGPNGTSGSFKIDFAALAQPQPQPASPPAPTRLPDDQSWLWSQFEVKQPLGQYAWPSPSTTMTRTYYVRIVPMSGNQPAGDPSNSVTIRHGPTGPQPTFQIVQDITPDLFDVEIVSFTPIQPASLEWGCVYIESIDPQVVMDNISPFQMPRMEKILAAWSGRMPYCPDRIEPKSWWEKIFGFLANLVSWVADAFNAIKDAVVGVVAKMIPGCSDSDWCKGALKIGTDLALTSLGIPPELPNLNQLVDEGLDYLVDVGAQALLDCEECGDAVKEAIRAGDTAGVRQYIKDYTHGVAEQVLTTYQNADVARQHGMQPLWLPPGVTAVPAPESGTQPAQVQIKITRKPTPPNYSKPIDLKRYRIRIHVEGTNNNIWPYGTFFTCLKNYAVPDCPVTVKLQQPLHGTLFESIDAPVPSDRKLKPGESMTIKFSLKNVVYWVPEHGTPGHPPAEYPSMVYAVHAYVPGHPEPTLLWWDDFQYLYRGGTAKVNAGVSCYQLDMGGYLWNPCGRQDEKSYPLPKDIIPGGGF